MARTIEERREADREHSRQFRLANPNYRRDWEEANREHRNAYRRAWRAKRREAARLAKIEARRKRFGAADAKYGVTEAAKQFNPLPPVIK